jgi:hypothetical protein
MKTTAEILSESRSLRFSFKKPDAVAETLIEQTFSVLPWHYYFGQTLGAVGFSFADFIANFYFDEVPPESKWVEAVTGVATVIIHGHSRDEWCATKTLCHVLGYKPDGLTELQEKNWRKLFD